jgi:spore coat polysaccharide biosynthesis protein SpsF
MLQSPQPPQIGIVIQARMSSRRLPGKVLAHMRGRTLLQHLVEACRQLPRLPLCVATSDETTDDPIAQHCAELSVSCHRGPLEDVAARMLGAATAHALHGIVRISADSPLMHPHLVSSVVDRFVAEPACDLATNVLRRTYPSGLSVEVLRTQALARAHPLMDAGEREHVTPYFYAHQDQFRIVSIERTQPLDAGKFSVDTPDDLRHMTALVERLQKPHWEYSLEQLAELSRSIAVAGVPS